MEHNTNMEQIRHRDGSETNEKVVTMAVISLLGSLLMIGFAVWTMWATLVWGAVLLLGEKHVWGAVVLLLKSGGVLVAAMEGVSNLKRFVWGIEMRQ